MVMSLRPTVIEHRGDYDIACRLLYFSFVAGKSNRNKYVGPPYSRDEIYAARMSRRAAAKRLDAGRCRSIACTRRRWLSIDISCARPSSTANALLVADAVDRRDIQTDRHSTVLTRFYYRILCGPRNK